MMTLGEVQVALSTFRDEIPRLQTALTNLQKISSPISSISELTEHVADIQLSPVMESDPHLSPVFKSSDADVVLRSSDGVEFKLFRRILMEGSPFFRTMFSLPVQPATGETLPIVDVPEDSSLLHQLMSFLYPIPDPQVDSLDELSTLIGASIKYDLVAPLATLRRLLISPFFTSQDAFRVFTIAVRHQLAGEVAIAARETFSISILEMPVTEDHKYLSGHDFFRLIRIHQRRAKEAQELIHNSRFQFKCPGCYRRNSVQASTWWIDWETRAAEELQRRPCTNVIFSVNFLAQSVKSVTSPEAMSITGNSRCNECALDLLNCQGHLDALRRQIDAISYGL